jgi:hypothetical protein
MEIKTKEIRMQFNLDSAALFKFLEDKVKVQSDYDSNS